MTNTRTTARSKRMTTPMPPPIAATGTAAALGVSSTSEGVVVS